MFQGLDPADAQTVLANVKLLRITLTSTTALLDDAFRLAVAHRRSVYDCLYVALSVRENCRFVTADEKLVNALGVAFSNIVWVPNWT